MARGLNAEEPQPHLQHFAEKRTELETRVLHRLSLFRIGEFW